MRFMDSVMDLSRIGDRGKLKPRAGDEPHWQRLRVGCYVGFRPSRKGGKGTWFARAYDADKFKYVRKPLGDYGALDGNDVFTQAKKDAEGWADQVESGGVRAEKVETVTDACKAYLKDRPGSIAEGVFRRHVYDDPIGKVRIDKLRRHHLREWRKRLESAPALVTRNKGGKTLTKPRSQSTANRDMVPLRAALGRLLTPGAPNTDAAWQEALKPAKGADRRRELYLDRAERKGLLAAVEAEAAPFVRGLCLLPLRPGTLAGLIVGDFDKRTRALTIGKDKNGKPRQITLPSNIADFLTKQSKDKLPNAPIFTRRGGGAWNKDTWKGPIKDAVGKADLPAAVSAYTLRHCVLTDLVTAGLPVLTVAQISGTSVAMIEKHYGHLVGDAAAEALAGLVL
ncbi:integrase [Mesorhizobium sp. L2C085B000]|uniref:tyrosine-type recombinase/integrase n=1 Tax=Mesorhizobium sp. L2C085B000 TaxID=1287117 RepID=UPI0003CFAF1E|nr:site-specific integrase [Mesorhizobium sp. L2C085B000]ESZ17325.1 integrase [Mesorhizobium sp. L2C085B000]